MVALQLYGTTRSKYIFNTSFFSSTRTLLAACNKWHKQRWLLHSISHLTGALLVATEIIELAEKTTDSRVKHMTRTLPYYLFIDGISILILCAVMLVVHNTLQPKSNKDWLNWISDYAFFSYINSISWPKLNSRYQQIRQLIS